MRSLRAKFEALFAVSGQIGDLSRSSSSTTFCARPLAHSLRSLHRVKLSQKIAGDNVYQREAPSDRDGIMTDR